MLKKPLVITLSLSGLGIGLIFLLPLCSANNRVYKNKISNTGSGQQLVYQCESASWESRKFVVLETPTPYQAQDWESAIYVGETTEGKLTLIYTDQSGQSVKIQRVIHIDNRTNDISYNDRRVATLGDIFSPLTSPMGKGSITLEMDFSYWITVSIVP